MPIGNGKQQIRFILNYLKHTLLKKKETQVTVLIMNRLRLNTYKVMISYR